MDTERPRDRRNLDAGRLLVALGALVLLVSLFLDWYGDEDSEVAVSGWTSFEIVDVLLAALALAAVYAVAESLVGSDRAPRIPDRALSLVGPIALVLVAVSLIDEPPLFGTLDPTREAGIWLALAAAALMTAGALLSTLRISLVVGARDRPRTADPATETRPMASPADPEIRR